MRTKFKILLYGCLLTSLSTTMNAAIAQHVDNKKHSLIDTSVLIFQSGFEVGCHIIRNSKNVPGFITSGYPIDVIHGADKNLSDKSDWVTDLEENPNGGNFMIEYTGGDSTKRWAKIIPEPGNPNNRVLAFKINDSWEASEHQIKGRVQADLYHIKKGYKEFFQRERVFIPEDMNLLRKFPDKITWLTISEFWNNEWWVAGEKHGFRISLGIGKPAKEESDLYFTLSAEDQGQISVWKAPQSNVKVPIGRWFTMEYYFKEGDTNTGRFYMAITPEGGTRQVVYDIHGYTHNSTDPNPDGLTGYNPMKLYTSKEVISYMKAQGKSLEIYWDDFKLWKNKTPE